MRKNPRHLRASWVPFGIGWTKPHHYLDILRVIWENRDNLGYAWRILRHGVCDGCSLGPRGLRDDTMRGVHLCMTRLRMLRLNTLPALDHARLWDTESLRRLSNADLRNLGRLAYPMLRWRGEPGFRRVTWEEALEVVTESLTASPPERQAFYTTSRGLTNEVYYVVQKAARLLGTNNVDNAARLCHAASTTALKQTLGVAGSTCSYSDWIGTDLMVLLGSNIANNQPVAMKYFYYARRQGTRFVVVNPYREPGLERYWIPSVTQSALFGTRFIDEFYPVRVGGDVAFLNGVLKGLIERGAVDKLFIQSHTRGFEELEQILAAQTWQQLEKGSGLSREQMVRFADTYGRARTAVFIWSMGLTQHRFGVQNVKAVVNLALARGMLGREKCGVVPVRGHSGVQGAAEAGCVPNAFPGGFPVNEDNARRFAELWGFPVPSRPGLTAAEMVDAAFEGKLDVFYLMGGNFLDTLPDPERVEQGLARVRCRIHQDLVLNHSMFVEPGNVVVLLPGQTRYEQPGGGTLTSTERRIRFSPEVPRTVPRRLGEERPEWQIMMEIAERAVGPERRHLIHFDDVRQIIAEMERAVPFYRGISGLSREGDSVQYGGPLLCVGGVCPTPDGRAAFTPLALPPPLSADDKFYLATRRGQQFNSMLYSQTDSLTGARRNEVFVSRQDAERLKLAAGDRIRLRSEVGEYEGVCRIVPPGGLAPGTLQAHWPEANVLLLNRLDPASKEPDYNVEVELEKIL